MKFHIIRNGAAEREERLQTLCTSLIANDPDITEVSTHGLPRGYGRRLGEALLENTMVTELCLCVSSFFRENDVNLDDGDSMLAYLRGRSASLKKVEALYMFERELNQELVDAIHMALASNPYIEHLHTECDITDDAFAHLVRNTTSIRSLYVEFIDKEYDERVALGLAEPPPPPPPPLPYPPPPRPAAVLPVPLAFEANQTLECLTLRTHKHVDVRPVLRALATHPTLTDLRLRLWYYDDMAVDQFYAVADLLTQSQTIQSLTLDSYWLDQQAMEPLLAALQSNKFVSKLVIRCKCDEHVTNMLVDFMQTRANKGDCALREFRLECPERKFQRQFRPEERSDVDVLLSMLGAGSSLERLSIGADVYVFDATEFLTRLTAGTVEGTMKLSGLVLDQQLSRVELEAMANYLRQTADLHDLSIGGLVDDSPASRRRLVSAIRSNGSLLNFCCKTGMFSTDATVSRLVGACLERNRLVRQLLNKPLLPTSSTMSGDETMIEVGAENVVVAATSNMTDLKRFPALFRSAQQAPRTTPNGMMMGLLATTIPGTVGLSLDDAS